MGSTEKSSPPTYNPKAYLRLREEKILYLRPISGRFYTDKAARQHFEAGGKWVETDRAGNPRDRRLTIRGCRRLRAKYVLLRWSPGIQRILVIDLAENDRRSGTMAAHTPPHSHS